MKQKGLAPLVIIILIALAVGGFLIYQKQLKPAVPQLVTQPSSTSVASDETANQNTGIDISDWQAYKNDLLSFQYPKDWIVNPTSIGDGRGSLEQEISIVKDKDTSKQILFTVKYLVKPNSETPLPSGTKFYYDKLSSNETLESHMKDLALSALKPTISSSALGDREAVVVSYPQTKSYKGSLYEYVLQKDGRIMEISIYPYLDTIFDQILSTFKFD